MKETFIAGYYDGGVFVYGDKKTAMVPFKTIKQATTIIHREFNTGQHVNIYKLVKVKTVKVGEE